MNEPIAKISVFDASFLYLFMKATFFDSAMVPVQFADVPGESTPAAQANTYYYSINFGEMEQFF